jgi:hypothetical protein
MYAIFKSKHHKFTSVLLYPDTRSEKDKVMNMWLLEHNEDDSTCVVNRNFVKLSDESLVAFKLKFGK